ncbi:MAG TPA: hypothetical protein PLE85_02060 [Bacteroidales bacterium]|nr:hypothetical protein [Bacteroidales bacterium]
MRRLSMIIPVVVIGFMIGMTTGCDYDHPVPEQISLDSVSFSANLIPYFNASCNMAGCHDAGGIPPDLTPENAYQDLFAKNQVNLAIPENSKLYRKVATGGSMEPYSKPAETAMVLAWIKQGAKNN